MMTTRPCPTLPPPTEYEVAWLATHGKECPSSRTRYTRFRADLKLWLIQTRGNSCEECGREFVLRRLATEYLIAHHVTPKADGGPDTPDNLILLCGQCHIAKHPEFELKGAAAPIAPPVAYVAKDEIDAGLGAFVRPDDPKLLGSAMAEWRKRERAVPQPAPVVPRHPWEGVARSWGPIGRGVSS